MESATPRTIHDSRIPTAMPGTRACAISAITRSRTPIPARVAWLSTEPLMCARRAEESQLAELRDQLDRECPGAMVLGDE